MFGRILVAVLAVTALDGELAHADTRGTMRFGVMPLELEASSDTPVFGDDVDRVIDRYNAAAAAYDQRTGGTTARLAAGDLGVTETLLLFAPGLEIDAGPYFFRMEALAGIADQLRSVGVGVYPINVQLAVRRSLVVYASGGGSASWLDRPGSGDVGALVALRAAAGVRVARHLVVEVGYNAFAIGGSVNNERLASMANGTAMELVQPDQIISAGEARGIVDASLGFTF